MDDYLFGGYWDKFAAAGLTINMGDYANSELYVKFDFLKEKMGRYKILFILPALKTF
jgi:hypothetical protein